jgi:hypothetical protein
MTGSSLPRRLALALCVFATATATVAATPLVQADSGKAVAAKKCKKKKKGKHRKCKKARPPATTTTPAAPTASQHTLTVVPSPHGDVVSSPAGINRPGDCTEAFNPGQPVSLDAMPAINYNFDGWGGDCTGGGACVVSMDADRTVSTSFTIEHRTLTVNVNGSGTVTSGDTVVNCSLSSPPPCLYQYDFGSVVTLTATPASGPWVFLGWTGACTGTGMCTVDMDANRSVTATFTDL